MSDAAPIHPALAPLARAAQAFGKAVENARGTGTVGPRPDHLVEALGHAVGEGRGWLRPEHRVGDPVRYMRHLLYVDPDDGFVITAIAWLPGQQSPVHAHYVWCGYGVAEGALTEELFRAPGALIEPLGTKAIRAGELAELDFGGPLYHRVSNRGDRMLVTLHVYGISADKLTTGINRIYAEQ